MGKVIFGFSAVGLVLGLALSQLSAGFGYVFPASPASLPISLLVLALANYLFSYPIYRYRKRLGGYKEGIRPERPNPFYAVRVLILARASVLAGALFAGWHAGLIILARIHIRRCRRSTLCKSRWSPADQINESLT